MRRTMSIGLACAIMLFCPHDGTAQEPTPVDSILRNYSEAIAKADLIRSRAVVKARDDAISVLTKLAAKAYKGNDRVAETDAWKAVLKLDREHKKANQYFTDLGILDKVQSDISEEAAAGPAAPAEAGPKTPPGKLAITKPVFQKWLQSVSILSAELQVEAVRKKLMELNPEFDGKLRPLIKSGVVYGVTFSNEKISDLSPIRVFSRLTSLTCDGSGGGVSALQDLSPLRDMQLYVVNCRGARIADLSPLKGMPLEYLNCDYCAVEDLKPLKDMPLRHLSIASTRVTDLSSLKGLGIEQLFCNLNQISDLSPLRGMPLTTLVCDETQVSDLSPLTGMKLVSLALLNAPVSDLAPLQGMPIERLNLSGTKVADLTPIKGMPLIYLYCQNTKVTDSSPLAGLQLKHLWFDFRQPQDLQLVRAMEKLELINNLPPAEFFKLQDSK